MDNDMIMFESNGKNAPDFIMSTASEALDLLAHYNSDFNRDIDKDEVASTLRIVSEYLQMKADLLTPDD